MVWDIDERRIYLYLNGQEVGRSNKINTIPKNFPAPATTCDIGLKRNGNVTTRGYSKTLMIVGDALTGEEIINMTGRATFFNFTASYDNLSLGTPRCVKVSGVVTIRLYDKSTLSQQIILF